MKFGGCEMKIETRVLVFKVLRPHIQLKTETTYQICIQTQ